MNNEIFEKIHRINYLAAETEALYHKAAIKIGVCDSIMIVLYTMLDSGEECFLGDIYKRSGISKQTVNSAVRRLESEDMICLKPYKGRAKKVLFTEKGREYAGKTAARLFDAEVRALGSWSKEEIDEHIFLMEKYVTSFRDEIENI